MGTIGRQGFQAKILRSIKPYEHPPCAADLCGPCRLTAITIQPSSRNREGNMAVISEYRPRTPIFRVRLSQRNHSPPFGGGGPEACSITRSGKPRCQTPHTKSKISWPAPRSVKSRDKPVLDNPGPFLPLPPKLLLQHLVLGLRSLHKLPTHVKHSNQSAENHPVRIRLPNPLA